MTPADWHDIQLLGWAMLAALVVMLGFPAWRRWRSGKPWHRPEASEFIELPFWLLLMLLLFLPNGILERHGISEIWAFLVPVGFLALAITLMIWSGHRKAKRSGIDNPNRAEVPQVPPSDEEKRVNKKVTLITLGFAVISIGSLVYAVSAIDPRQIAQLGWVLGLCAVILAIMIFAMVGRLPWPMTLSSSIEVRTTPQAVWDALVYAGGKPHYKQIVRRVERLNAAGEAYRLHYFNDSQCSSCHLPLSPDAPGRTARVEVLQAVPASLYRLRAIPEGKGIMGAGLMAFEDEEFRIEARPGGRTLVTNSDTIHRPRVWLAALLKLGDPLGENLRHLKAHLEGAEGDTLFDTGTARIEAQRRAPRFCGCPAEA